MLEIKDCCSSVLLLPFVAVFVNQCIGHERTALLTKAHKRYSEMVYDVTEKKGQPA